MPCCGLMYYCVNGEIVTTEPGTKEAPTPPPPGFSGGPWPTIEEAEAGCSPPDYQLIGCCSTTITLPSVMHLSFTDVTGWLIGKLPNSLKITISPNSMTGGFSSPSTTVVFPGSSDLFAFDIYGGCSTTVLNHWIVTIRVATSAGCGTSSSGTGSPPWTFTGGGSAGGEFFRFFACSNSWPLATPEILGTISLVCTAGAASFKVVVLR